MTATGIAPTVKGWCPGALRPMESGDGLIVRLRIAAGIADPALAARIADWSRRWGNGLIDLSNRANLQMRGVARRHLPDLWDALRNAGLLDASEAAEAVRNVVCSPLAGLDPDAVLDIRPIVRALGQRLAGDTTLHTLPGKFGFAIGDGGMFGAGGAFADIRFEARRTADGPVFDIHLAGAPDWRLGPCRPAALSDVAADLATAFLRLRTGQQANLYPDEPPAMPDPPMYDGRTRPHGDRFGIRRMRDLTAAYGAEAVAQAAGLALCPSLPAKHRARPADFLGAHRLGSNAFAGVGLRFGRIGADDLAALAAAAAANGAETLRLTPWRAILVPVPSVADAHRLIAALPAGSFILDPDDPILRVAACPGAPACHCAAAPVRDAAASLAAAVASAPGSGIVLHVSGCEKGCAHPRPAPFTLVGRDGYFDLIRDGVASAEPASRRLTLAQAAAHIQRIAATGREQDSA